MSLIKYLNTGKDGNPIAKTRCIVACDSCENRFNRNYKTRISHLDNPDIHGDYCQSCIQKLPSQRKKMSKIILKMIQRDPDWKKRNSESKKGKINLGENNGMKKELARKKLSDSRKAMFKNPLKRKELSDSIAKAWAGGKYDGVKVGRCKWFDFKKKDGTIAKCQGTWELKYAEWLDKNDIEFLAHRGRISYIQNATKRSYYPDFYLIKEDIYIDIKNKYHFSLNEEKFDLIRAQNPAVTIELKFKDDLKSLGIDL